MTLSMMSLASAAAAILTAAPLVSAGFSSSSQSNIAVYWGQNSAGGTSTQERLSYYCSNTDIDIITLSFMYGIKTPSVDFASASNSCTAIDGTKLQSCPEIEADIISCQKQGKTILLSIGGATYSEGGFSSSDAAESAAENVWNLFGTPTTTSNRPFGTAVVDGFDFDFESSTQNMAPFGKKLRSLMDAADGTYYLSAAPQCPYPDVADNDMLDGAVSFDFIQIQFYNNNCGVNSFTTSSSTQSTFNLNTWDNWAQNTSANKDVKLLVGVPASSSAAGSGYVSSSTLGEIITYSKQYSTFGGIMMWDMSQLWANSGYLDAVASSLGTSSGSSSGSSSVALSTATATKTASSAAGSATTTVKATTTKTATTTAKATTLQTSTRKATSSAGSSTASSAAGSSTGTSSTTGVAQWGQCGGTGYTGSTTCQGSYKCVEISSAWSQCE